MSDHSIVCSAMPFAWPTGPRSLPQHLPLTAGSSVAEVLGVHRTLAALRAIEAGDAGEEHFTTVGSDWDVEERTLARLDRLGLAGLDLNRPLGTVSGGQAGSLGLAVELRAAYEAFEGMGADAQPAR